MRKLLLRRSGRCCSGQLAMQLVSMQAIDALHQHLDVLHLRLLLAICCLREDAAGCCTAGHAAGTFRAAAALNACSIQPGHQGSTSADHSHATCISLEQCADGQQIYACAALLLLRPVAVCPVCCATQRFCPPL